MNKDCSADDIKGLVALGADVNALNSINLTPLDLADIYGNADAKNTLEALGGKRKNESSAEDGNVNFILVLTIIIALIVIAML